jgi:hypothetical protein
MTTQTTTKEEKEHKREFLQEIRVESRVSLDIDNKKDKKDKVFIDEINVPE